MTDLPLLPRQAIEKHLEDLYRHSRRHYLVAYHGTGIEEAVQPGSAGRALVVPVRSELELRARMPRLGDQETRMAFLVPWTTEVPVDLQGRFAKNGRVFRIETGARLASLFRGCTPDADAAESPLARYLLAHRSGRTYPVPVAGGVLTRSMMWASWLQEDWRVAADGGLALDTLLGWAAADGRGPEFAAAMREGDGAEVRAGLFEHLAREIGPAGPVVWKCWERGQGAAALELAILFEALVSSDHGGVRMWCRERAKALPGGGEVAEIDAVVARLGQVAGAALGYMESRHKDETWAAIRRADERADEPEVRAALIESARLPGSWKQRLDDLGRKLEQGAREPGAGSVEVAVVALRRVEGHALFAHPEQTRVVQRAEMAVRLLSWLAGDPSTRLESSLSSHGDVENLGRWYAEEGGYVDRARRMARGPAAGDFGRGVQAVVEAADGLRVALDLRFARSLGPWIDARRPAQQVVPIDQAVTRIAARWLDGEPSRRLLVLLFDGMAWAQAVELLESLGSHGVPWGPLAWHATGEGRIGEGAYPVVLAALPTTTEVSRAAFFGGRPMTQGARLGTSDDVERWKNNKDAARFCAASDAPRLLLRGEGHAADGSASSEARQLVEDTRRRLVAVVVNAIDASLKGDAQAQQEWSAASIRSLADLLEAAREAGRAVLMASDHGHVPADRLASAGTYTDAGQRFRPWLVEGDPVADHEVAFDAGSTWAPKGARGVILLADDAHRYGGGAGAGAHGGATLAEVVTPCLLLGCKDMEITAGDDPGLRVHAPHVPGWWHFDVPAAPGMAPVPGGRKQDQLPLPQVGAPVAAPRPPKRPARPAPRQDGDLSKTGAAFAKSKVLAARAEVQDTRDKVVRAVDFLLRRNGMATERAFGDALGILPRQVAGFVSVLQEVLNVDGYEIVRLDRVGRQVRMDVAKLTQQFEVEP